MNASKIYDNHIAARLERLIGFLHDRSSVTAAASLAVIFFVFGATIQVMQHWPFEPPYEPLNVPPHATSNQYHYAHQRYGNRLVVGQNFRVNKEVQLHFSREVVLRSLWQGGNKYDQVWLRRQLEPTTVFYRPGVYKVERELPLMVLPPGSYLLLTTVCWEVNFMRTDCIDHPELPLEITEPYPS